MYNFNDIMVCAEPYVNLKRTGIIIGILPFDMRGYSEQLMVIVNECLSSDTMDKLVHGKDSNINGFFFDQVVEKYYDNTDMDCFPRVFYLDGCTIFALECSRFYQYHGTATWKQAASKYTNIVRFKRACFKSRDRRFKTDMEEYEFLVNVIELGSISTIALIAEINETDLLAQAFYRASLQSNGKTTMGKRIAPTYHNVINIKFKLARRWQIKDVAEVFDIDVTSLYEYNMIQHNIHPFASNLKFDGFSTRHMIRGD